VRLGRRILARVDEEIRGLGSGYELELVLVDLGRDVVDTLILDEGRRGEEGLVADILQLLLQRSDLTQAALIDIGPCDHHPHEEETVGDEANILPKARQAPQVILDPLNEAALAILFALMGIGIVGLMWSIRFVVAALVGGDIFVWSHR